MPQSCPPIRLAACGALTAFGDERAALAAMLDGRSALQAVPVLGADGGDAVPLGLAAGHDYADSAPPSWFPALQALAARIPGDGWGTPRRPVFFTSSNFGVGNLYAYRRHGDEAHLQFGTPHRCVERIVTLLGWGPNHTTFSHACVSAHLGLMQAARALDAGLADEALVFSFDFVSPFVAGGFHALKILNDQRPAPYHDGATGSIGLGDGAAFAVLTRDRGDHVISGQTLFNEMQHFTANQPDGSGFTACLSPIREEVRAHRVWLKGHGTGTLEAGRLEATVLRDHFGDAPLVSWKGALGHTLGSCGLVELAIAAAAIAAGRAPGTVGTRGPTFTDSVATDAFALGAFDAVLCTSNAFGGAHAAYLLHHG